MHGIIAPQTRTNAVFCSASSTAKGNFSYLPGWTLSASDDVKPVGAFGKGPLVEKLFRPLLSPVPLIHVVVVRIEIAVARKRPLSKSASEVLFCILRSPLA